MSKRLPDPKSKGRKTVTTERMAKDVVGTAARLIGKMVHKKNADLHFNFLLFGKFGFIGARVTKFKQEFLGLVSMHDFIYGNVLGIYFFYIFYLFSSGPVAFVHQMKLVGILSLVLSVLSLIFSIISGIFKFNLTQFLEQASIHQSQTYFNVYFFVKMIYVVVSIFMGFYFTFAFIVRWSIEHIELPEGAAAFKEGRKELGSKEEVLVTLLCNGIFVLLMTFHMTENIYWLKLMSTSWNHLITKIYTEQHDPDDEDEEKNENDENDNNDAESEDSL